MYEEKPAPQAITPAIFFDKTAAVIASLDPLENPAVYTRSSFNKKRAKTPSKSRLIMMRLFSNGPFLELLEQTKI